MSPTRKHQLLQMLEKDPADQFLNYALALEYAKENDLKTAISIIRNIIDADENYLGGYYQLGKFYEADDDPESAKEIFEKGIQIARKQGNRKTASELQSAIDLMD
jgi:Tfp pilus assembly protein PilF